MALDRSGLIGGPKSDNFAWNGGAPAGGDDPALSGETGPFNLVIAQGDEVRETAFPDEAACARARDADVAASDREEAEARRKGEGGTFVWRVVACLPASARQVRPR